LPASGDFLEDTGRGLGPYEGLCPSVATNEIALGGSFELGAARQRVILDAIGGDRDEEALDLVEPGGRTRW
jgi:hypothetical protein